MNLTDDERRERHQRQIEDAIARLRHRLFRKVAELDDIGERHMDLLNHKLAGEHHKAVAGLRSVASCIGKIGENTSILPDLTTAELASLFQNDRRQWANYLLNQPDIETALNVYSDVLAYIERKCALMATTARDPDWDGWQGPFKEAATYFVTR